MYSGTVFLTHCVVYICPLMWWQYHFDVTLVNTQTNRRFLTSYTVSSATWARSWYFKVLFEIVLKVCVLCNYAACTTIVQMICRDAKSSISGGRLPYLDVHYGLPYGRTCLPFSPFTYGRSGGDRHTHAGEAAVLLLYRQVHHYLLIYAVLMQSRDARDVARL